MRNKHHALLGLALGVIVNTSLVSVAIAGGTQIITSNSTSGNNIYPTINADGRYVTFHSNSAELVSGDTNNSYDVFVYDRDSNIVERVSIASDGSEGDKSSIYASISADGRYVAFHSAATNLIANDANPGLDVFMHDRQLGITELISKAADGSSANSGSYSPALSPDGRYVAYFSSASNLVAGDTNNVDDVFIYDRELAVTERISIASDETEANDLSRYPSLSSDGRYVSFYSEATNLVAGDSNATGDIFTYDRQSKTTQRISISTAGDQANNQSRFPSMSGDGRYVLFESSASNLVADDGNNTSDIFLHDRDTGITQLLSKNSDGVPGNSLSQRGWITTNGRFVTFTSSASNLITSDTNGKDDVFIHDRVAGTTQIVSLADDGQSGDNNSLSGLQAASSENGRYIVFYSLASNLTPGDNNTSYDIFIRDAQTSVVLPPIADAGPDQKLECTNQLTDVVLNGSGSSDPDGDPLSYTWSGIFGTAMGEIVTVGLPVGAHSISLSVQDAQFPAVSDRVVITVKDSVAPSLSSMSDVLLEATSVQGASHDLSPSATDLCSDVTFSQTPDLSIYPLGSTTVTVTASDLSGNTATATVVVSVEDTSNPVLTVPADITTPATGPLTPVDLGNASATDIFAVTISNDAPANGFPAGISDVTWTATDANGNVSSAVQRVTIISDTEKPILEAALIRLKGSDDDSGWFRVEYSCTDTGSGIKNLDADLNGVAVDTGDIVLLILDDDVRKPRYKKRRYLRMIASQFDLNVSCEDGAGNIETATVRAPLDDD